MSKRKELIEQALQGCPICGHPVYLSFALEDMACSNVDCRMASGAKAMMRQEIEEEKRYYAKRIGIL